MALQSKGGQELKEKKTTECYKGQFPDTHKIPYMLLCCY
jgi:hypothetical protein